MSKIQKDEISRYSAFKEKLDEGFSLRAVGEMFGVSRQTVWNVINKHGRRSDQKIKRQKATKRFPPMLNLKLARLARRLSVEALASMVGVSKKLIYDYEQGRRLPNDEVLTKISCVLNRPVEYLTGNTTETKPQ